MSIVSFYWNNEKRNARLGQSIAGALIEQGELTLRQSLHRREPRGVFCCIGECYECQVNLGNGQLVRACTTLVEPEMKVYSSPVNEVGSEHE